MSHRATVHQLESDFADAMTRLYAVGNGLARLRTELDSEVAGAAAPPARPPVTVPVPAPTGTPTAATAAEAGSARTAARTASTQTPAWPASVPPPGAVPGAPAVAWYRREGAVTRVLAVTGAVITMSGVAMLLVLAVQQGWFGPAARVASGAVLAAVLLGLGARGGERDRRTHGTVGSAPVALVATGAAAAYLDVVAVTSGYGWVRPGVGLALAGLVALSGLHLARRWGSELLAVLMLLGAAGLAPAVGGGPGWVVSAFLGILCVVGWWAGGTATRPLLTVARVVPVTLALLVSAVDTSGGSVEEAGQLAVAAVVLAVTLVTSTLSVGRDPDDASASAAVVLLAVGLLATTAPLAEPQRTLVLGVAAALMLLVATSLGRPPVGPVAPHLVATVGGLGTVLAVLAVLSGAPDRLVATGLLLLALAGLVAAGVARSRLVLALAGGATVVAVVAWLQHPFAVTTASTAAGHDMVAALVDSLLVGAVVVVGLWATREQQGLGREVRLAVTITAWVLGLSATATVFAAVGTLLGARAGEPVTGFTVGHAVATVTWMLAAAWLLLRGLDRSKDTDLTLRTGLVLAGVSVGKLFLFDLAALNGIVRSVAFIAMGLLLLATGSRYAKAYERSRLST